MSNFLLDLKNFSTEFNKILKVSLEKESGFYKRIGNEPNILFGEIIRTISSGGKRIRPAQLYYSYLACGGKDKETSMQVAVSLEILHTFALIHDDILDKSIIRRGSPTSQEYFRQQHKNSLLIRDNKHFALSSAILAGDLALTLADKTLTDINLKPNVSNKLKKAFDSLRLEVVAGEFMDVYAEYLPQLISETDVLRILRYKTGTYTSGRPWQMGAILAEANLSLEETLFETGTKAGIVFQIQDDILGVFGKEKEIGKSTNDDLKEGKKTLLIVKAFEFADKQDKDFMEKIVGNKHAQSKDLNKVREIIKKSGSLEYSIKFATKLITDAKKRLSKLELYSEGKDFLMSLVNFMLERKI